MKKLKKAVSRLVRNLTTLCVVGAAAFGGGVFYGYDSADHNKNLALGRCATENDSITSCANVQGWALENDDFKVSRR